MGGQLTTHVLDTAKGIPAKGIKIQLFHLADGDAKLIKTLITNEDGRTDIPLLNEEEFFQGSFELIFHTGKYTSAEFQADKTLSDNFYDSIPVKFNIFINRKYHVPLLLSPFGYSTYLGS